MCSCRELTLEQMLSDPIVETLMEADAVDPRKLQETLSVIARKRQAAEAIYPRSAWAAGERITSLLARLRAGRKKIARDGWAGVRLLWA